VERNAERPPGEARSLPYISSCLCTSQRQDVETAYLFNLRIVWSTFLTPASKSVLFRSLGSALGAASAILSTTSLTSGVSATLGASGWVVFSFSSDMARLVRICNDEHAGGQEVWVE
jgi:hypothetical protein